MFVLAAVYLATINLTAFAAFASDKRRAIHGERRISESTLLGLAMLGGASGAIAAQQLLRHKTRKEPFRTTLWLVAALQALILLAGGYWAMGPRGQLADQALAAATDFSFPPNAGRSAQAPSAPP